MKLNVFAVYDEKGQVYANPWYFAHKGEAVRHFQDVCADPQSRISKHLSDFSLYLLGSYDDAAGKFSSLSAPEFILKAVDFKPPED